MPTINICAVYGFSSHIALAPTLIVSYAGLLAKTLKTFISNTTAKPVPKLAQMMVFYVLAAGTHSVHHPPGHYDYTQNQYSIHFYCTFYHSFALFTLSLSLSLCISLSLSLGRFFLFHCDFKPI